MAEKKAQHEVRKKDRTKIELKMHLKNNYKNMLIKLRGEHEPLENHRHKLV